MKTTLLIALALLATVAHADQPLVGDRPDFTESALAVPTGSLQLEAGVTLDTSDAADMTTVGELLVRYGIKPGTELRLIVPSYLSLEPDGGDKLTGSGNLAFGFKQQLGHGEDGPRLAVLSHVTLPTGNDDVTASDTAVDLVLAAEWDLADNIGLGMNVGGELVFDQDTSAPAVGERRGGPWRHGSPGSVRRGVRLHRGAGHLRQLHRLRRHLPAHRHLPGGRPRRPRPGRPRGRALLRRRPGHEVLAMISESVADYLTEILRLEEAGEPASTSELATRLQVARPSVSGMLRRLADERLVTYAPYQGAHLTARGRRRAQAMLRRHRLVETFLVNALAMPPEKVHQEAHRWEHALSDDAVDRLDRWLGNPAADPHGTPIPGRDANGDQRTLGALDVDRPARVSRLASRDPEHAAYLSSLGLRRGAVVTVTERRPFAGPVTLDVDGRSAIVGPEVTEYVSVHKEQA